MTTSRVHSQPDSDSSSIAASLSRPGTSAVWTCVVSILLSGALLAASDCARAFADAEAFWTPNGIRISTLGVRQDLPAIASDRSGGAFTAFVARLMPGARVQAQRLTALGEAQWPGDGTFIAMDSLTVTRTRAISDAAGNAFVAWSSFSKGVRVQRIDSDGTPRWASGGVQLDARAWTEFHLASDGAGGVIVVWGRLITGGLNPPDTLMVQRVDSTGATRLQPGGQILAFANNFEFNVGQVDSGGAFVCWGWNPVPGTHEVRAQWLNQDGSLLWPADGLLVAQGSGGGGSGAMVGDGAGGVIHVYGHSNALFAQRISRQGEFLWSTGGVSVSTASPTFVAGVPSSGGAIVTWRTGTDILAAHVDSAGVPGWDPNGVEVCVAQGLQGPPRIVSDGVGGAIIAWDDEREGSANSDIYAQRLDASGAARWAMNGFPICSAPARQAEVVIAADNANGAILAWFDQRNGSAQATVYAQRVGDACPSALVRDCCTDAPSIEWIAGSGAFEQGSNWQAGQPPDITKRALFHFDAIGEPTVTFNSAPTLQDLTVNMATTTFSLQSRTLRLLKYVACNGQRRSLGIMGDACSFEGALTISGGRVLADGDVVLGVSPDLCGGGTARLVISDGGELVVDEDDDGDALIVGQREITSGSAPGALAEIVVSDGILRTKSAARVGSSGATAATDSGNVSLSGANSIWLGDLVTVGGTGSGSIYLSAGAKATLSALDVLGASSRVALRDPETQLIANAITLPNGALDLSQDGAVVVESLLVGGRATIAGVATKLQTGQSAIVDVGGFLEILATQSLDVDLDTLLIVGDYGSGTMRIADFGLVQGRHASFGHYSGASGALDLDNGSIGLTGTLSAGPGDATFTLNGTSAIQCNKAILGIGAIDGPSQVTINLTGASAQLFVETDLYLGVLGGQAALFGGGGATVAVDRAYVGPGSSVNFTGVKIGDWPTVRRAPSGPFGEDGSVFSTNSLFVEAGASLLADSVLLGPGGTLAGDGAIDVSLINDGTLWPGRDSIPSTMVLLSDYVQTTAGRLRVTLSDSTSDALYVSGAATLGGTLEFDLLPSSTPVNGRQFEVLIGHPVIGVFDSVPSNIEVTYTDTSVVLTHTAVGVESPSEAGSQSFALEPIQNPIRGATTIAFSLARVTDVALDLFDVSGRRVRRLLDHDVRTSGRHEVAWDGTDSEGRSVQSGVYLVRLEAAGHTDTRRLVLFR